MDKKTKAGEMMKPLLLAQMFSEIDTAHVLIKNLRTARLGLAPSATRQPAPPHRAAAGGPRGAVGRLPPPTARAASAGR